MQRRKEKGEGEYPREEDKAADDFKHNEHNSYGNESSSSPTLKNAFPSVGRQVGELVNKWPFGS